MQKVSDINEDIETFEDQGLKDREMSASSR